MAESLDVLLARIQSDSNLELAEPLDAPKAQSPAATGPVLAAPSSTVGQTVQERNPMWESNLTPQQRALPKISAQMMGGIVAVMVLFAGVGAATMLTQESQDIRQQASEGNAPSLAGRSAALSQKNKSTLPGTFGELQQLRLSQVEWIVIIGAGISIIVLLVFLVWLFLL
jgi:hypothetical protein